MCFFLIGIPIRLILNEKYNYIMSDTRKGKVVFEERFISKNSGLCSVYTYSNNKKIMIYGGCGDFLKKGDTVLVKYSIEDPSVAEVIDFCYMKKHKGKVYCDCEE